MLRALFLAILFGPMGLPAGWQSAAEAGQMAPAFSLVGLTGETRTLGDYQGHILLLNFWATWCAPCRHEMPALESLYRTHRDEGLVVIGVASDALGARTVGPFVQELGLTFPILLDPKSRVTRLYGVSVRPTTYLIDSDGGLVSRFVGQRDWTGDGFAVEIRRLLQARATSAHTDRDNGFHPPGE